MARWRNDPRGGTDPLYDETTDEVDGPGRWRLFFRAFAEIALVFCFILPLWLGAVVAMRTVDNWMDGRGFTPVTHQQLIAPTVQEIAPASFTIKPMIGQGPLPPMAGPVYDWCGEETNVPNLPCATGEEAQR